MVSERTNTNVNKDYWEQNIEKYAGFYYVNSEEDIGLASGFSILYKKIIFPLERRVTLDRYNFVCDFIERHVVAGTKVADIGCGSGIFSRKMLEQGANVRAFDFASNAVDLTRRNMHAIEGLNTSNLTIEHLDITKGHIPEVDVAIAIGVLPYVADAGQFFNNILPYTKRLVVNYIDKNNLFNVARRILPVMNVRNYSYHSQKMIREHILSHGFRVTRHVKLGTGFILEMNR